MPKPDEGHRLTDIELEKLEKRIAAEYKKAADEMQDKVTEYFAYYRKREQRQRDLLDAGKITEEQFKQWRLAQIGRGKRLEDLRDKLAERMTKANEVTAAYINDATPGVYTLNRNYSAYTIEKEVGADVGFTMWDEQTVKRMIKEQPDLMPYYPTEKAVNRGIDLKWGKQQIAAQVTTGILTGESLPKIAKRLKTNIPDMNRNSAIRAARTAITGAQNAGRMESYHAAEEMGIELRKSWLATLDNRTRHAHAALDGQTAEIDSPFESELGPIMYPGDPNAAPANIYNCRCSLIADLPELRSSNAQRRARDPETGENVLIKDMTYAEWEKWKKSENATAWEVYKKKSKNYAADQRQYSEYKKILGKNIPKTFAEFQNLKYNRHDEWEDIKKKKRQTVFVNNAPCITTPKKYSEFFLKDGAKHAQDFFDVGYTADDVLQLRYDMAYKFDIAKAVDSSIDDRGVEKFNIYMQLGVTTKKRFRTCWQKDTPNSLPRIITAFRDDKYGDK